MDFTVPEEIERLCESIHAFMREHVYPLEQQHTREPLAVAGPAYPPAIAAVQAKAKALGYWAFHLAEGGGRRRSAVHALRVRQRDARPQPVRALVRRLAGAGLRQRPSRPNCRVGAAFAPDMERARRQSMDFSTTCLGVPFPHPFMPGASPLVDDLDTVRRLEDAGAAAIAMHPLLEEQG